MRLDIVHLLAQLRLGEHVDDANDVFLAALVDLGGCLVNLVLVDVGVVHAIAARGRHLLDQGFYFSRLP